MNLAGKFKAGSLVIMLVFGLNAFASDQPRKFDEFGDINCEDEMAHLDNLVVILQNEPSSSNDGRHKRNNGTVRGGDVAPMHHQSEIATQHQWI
jgi:hypothetical protein